jgi:hypothetical protein
MYRKQKINKIKNKNFPQKNIMNLKMNSKKNLK